MISHAKKIAAYFLTKTTPERAVALKTAIRFYKLSKQEAQLLTLIIMHPDKIMQITSLSDRPTIS